MSFSSRVLFRLARNGWLNWLPDETILKIMYKSRLHRKPDFVHPKTYNEKMQWLKLHDRKPIHTRMVDKIEAKGFIADVVGEQYTIPTLGVWDRAEDIDFDSLPDRFVLKCNHDSHSVIVCKDKSALDRKQTVFFLSKHLKQNGYWFGREWPYKNVRPRILAEEYLEDETGELTDYKIHCYNGNPKIIQVITDRFSPDGMINNHYTLDWEQLDMVRGHFTSIKKAVPKPPEMDEMLQLAEQLAKDTYFLRTDFYIVNHRIYCGELTFFPASGFNPFTPDKWDTILGEWIRLPIDQ